MDRRRKAAIINWWYSGGGKQYSPLDFPDGLQAYHNVLQMSTAYGDGNPVTLVDDLSGNAKHMTTPGTFSPTYAADFGDGFPAITLDGAMRFILNGGKAGWNFMHQGPSTSMWLVRTTVDNATQYLFSSMTYGNNADGRADVFRIFVAGLNGSFEVRMRGGSTTMFNMVVPEQKAPKDQWLLIWIVCDAGKCTMYVNNVAVQTQNIIAAYQSNDSINGPRAFGTESNFSNWFKGSYRTSAFWNVGLHLETIQKISGGVAFG